MFVCLTNEELEYAAIEKCMLQLMEILGKIDFATEMK
jgi:hypothetical protein